MQLPEIRLLGSPSSYTIIYFQPILEAFSPDSYPFFRFFPSDQLVSLRINNIFLFAYAGLVLLIHWVHVSEVNVVRISLKVNLKYRFFFFFFSETFRSSNHVVRSTPC